MKKDLSHYTLLNYPIEILRFEEGVFAFHPDLDGCAAQGSTVDEAIANLDAARQLWLQVRIEDGLPIEEPVNEDECSGRVSLRMSSNIHAELVKMSRRQHVSLNQLLNTILAEYVGGNRLQQQFLEAIRELKSSIAFASVPQTFQQTAIRMLTTTGTPQGQFSAFAQGSGGRLFSLQPEEKIQ